MEYPVCYWSEVDPFTLRDCVQGVQIFGGIGSGKTSGSGRFLAESFLRAGYGGLVLTVKNDERVLWEEYCQRNGRENELVIFSPDEQWRFNFLEYEMKRSGRGSGQTENLVNIFMSVLETKAPKSNSQGGEFWLNAVKQLLRNSIDLLKIAGEEISVKQIYEVVNSAPQNPADLQPVMGSNGKKQVSSWVKTSYCAKCISTAKKQKNLSHSQQQDLQVVLDYWIKQYPSLDPKTRSNILFTFTGFADVFVRGVLRDLFCTTTNIYPEMIPKGAIILLDLPVHEYNEIGEYAQIIFKFIFQKFIERRTDKERPVFLWADEAQFFINKHDVKFQSTARSSKTITVFLTQNIGRYFETLGENLAHSLLGNLQTKIFHQNTDEKTNEYASKLIDHIYQQQASTTMRRGMYEEQKESGSSTFSESLAPQVLPVEFSNLPSGGPGNDYKVAGIVFQGGKRFNQTGNNWLVNGFEQVE